MPGLPELLHIQTCLKDRLAGASIVGERLRMAPMLQCLVHGNLSTLLGRRLEDVLRHGQFLVLRCAGLDLAVHLLPPARFRFAQPGEADEVALAFVLTFRRFEEAEVELRLLDEKLHSKAYLLGAGDLKAIPDMETRGVDVLSPQFTRERLVSLLKHRRDTVRAFLLDPHALDSLGPAYADEVLFAAGLHPLTPCRALDHAAAVRLHGSIVGVVHHALDEIARHNPPLEVGMRGFLKVQPQTDCPRCGDRIRTARVHGGEAHFCPRCQPAPAGPVVRAPRQKPG